jgi:hypothetical protein
VDAVDADARRLRDEGFLLNRDLKEIVDRAEDAAIPFWMEVGMRRAYLANWFRLKNPLYVNSGSAKS